MKQMNQFDLRQVYPFGSGAGGRNLGGFRLALMLLLIGLLSLQATAVALAHEPELLRSDPLDGARLKVAPSRVKVWFSEELVSQQSTLQVFAADGRRVDRGDGGVDLNDPNHASLQASLPELPDGMYTVRWHVILEDGDAVEGAFSFTVGEAWEAGQMVAARELEISQESHWLVGGIVASLGVLLAATMILFWGRPPSSQGS